MAESCQDHRDVTEIALERTANGGFSPGYRITFRNNGNAVYVGSQFAKRQGTYEGNISSSQYDQLVNALVHGSYFQLDKQYPPLRSEVKVHADMVTTSVVCSGHSKIVSQYDVREGSVSSDSWTKKDLRVIEASKSGRQKHEQIVHMIDNISDQIQWKKIP